MSGHVATRVPQRRGRAAAGLATGEAASWTGRYLRQAGAVDGVCALAGGLLAFRVRFDDHGHAPAAYLGLSLSLPLIWLGCVALAGGYDSRFVGVGSDEFRRVVNAGVGLTAAVAILAYATKTDIARGYVVIALPCATIVDLFARYALRKRLHRLRKRGSCLRRVLVVGHPPVVADLAAELRRGSYHGLSVVAACLVGQADSDLAEIAGVPAVVGLGSVAEAVRRFETDTVAVLACPEMSGIRLRELAWELEKTGTDLCVAPALLDVAGPAHHDQAGCRAAAAAPRPSGVHRRAAGDQVGLRPHGRPGGAGPGLARVRFTGLAIRLADGGPALFRQTRVGQDGRPFTVYKFRTMVVDAEERKPQLAQVNETDGVLFKVRDDPRITRLGD